MKKGKRDYIILVIVFLIIVFSSNIDSLLIAINPNLAHDNIVIDHKNYLKKEFDELKQIHDLNINDQDNLIISKVKFRNVYEFNNTVTIYKGFKDGVYASRAVVTNEGLVGVIKNAYEHTSVVELLSNPKSEISVVINDAYGILKYRDGLVVKEISNYKNISVGDKIYTSGFGNLPGGIFVGIVKEVNLNNTGIEQVVVVDTKVNLNNLNYLFVLGDSDD